MIRGDKSGDDGAGEIAVRGSICHPPRSSLCAFAVLALLKLCEGKSYSASKREEII